MSNAVAPSILSSLDSSAQRALLRAHAALVLRENYEETLESTDNVVHAVSKRSRRPEPRNGVDSGHIFSLVPVGDDHGQRRAVNDVIAHARKASLVDPSGLTAQQIDLLAKAAWAEDHSPRATRPRQEWEEDMIGGFSSRVKPKVSPLKPQ